MKYVVSRYNHKISWLNDYTDDVVLYDRSEHPVSSSIIAPNIGSDIYDKLSFIIDNFDSLPEVACYIKANLFDYIRPKEFELIKDNTTFTPIVSQMHKVVMCDEAVCRQLGVQSKEFSFYKDGMYYELNYPFFLRDHKTQNPDYCYLNTFKLHPLYELLKIKDLEYLPFAPGSNYIVPKATILKHPKDLYIKLRSFLGWAVYPGEAMIIERGLYTLWN